MPIYGARFRALGQTNYYSAAESLARGDYILVEAEHGQAVAEVVSGPLEKLANQEAGDIPAIIRRANSEDMDILRKNLELGAQAKIFCKERIARREMDMKLVDVEIYFDRSKFIFYFTAPTRIDFRELVKDLVREYHARIELRQIGVRHETQMLGAIGNCGQVCCCRGYLRKFAPVTIRMAKEQNLFLNPAKISGICGRLLCCLSYEQENYEQFHRDSPQPGRRYQTAKGLLKVQRVNMFKNTLTAINESNAECEFTLDEWNALKPWRSGFNSREQENDIPGDQQW